MFLPPNTATQYPPKASISRYWRFGAVSDSTFANGEVEYINSAQGCTCQMLANLCPFVF